MNKIRLTALMVIAVALLTACGAIPVTFGSTQTQPTKVAPIPSNTQPPKIPNQLTPTASALPSAATPPATGGDELLKPILTARSALAEKLKLKTDQIEVISFNPMDWQDACFGMPAKGEMCAQMITPGYRVMLRANHQLYEARTSSGGQTVRFAPPGIAENTSVAEKARSELALLLRSAPETITILDVEELMFPDSCLGIRQPKIQCLQVVTPGYQISLGYQGKTYIYHTNKTGTMLLLASSPDSGNGTPAEAGISWMSSGQPCRSAQISPTTISYGTCGMPQLTLRWQNPEHQADYQHFTVTFRSFNAETKVGSLQFTGSGERQAAAAEQRAIAEWVQLAVGAASTGSGGSYAGLALNWQREGGIAGFCDDLLVYRSGVALASTCRGNSARKLGFVYLSGAQLEQLFTWLDELKTFDFKSSDPATADAMRIHLLLNGMGNKEANETAKQALGLFAQDIYAGISQGK